MNISNIIRIFVPLLPRSTTTYF